MVVFIHKAEVLMTEKGLKNMFYPVNSVGGKDNIIITCMQEPFVNVNKLEVCSRIFGRNFSPFSDKFVL